MQRSAPVEQIVPAQSHFTRCFRHVPRALQDGLSESSKAGTLLAHCSWEVIRDDLKPEESWRSAGKCFPSFAAVCQLITKGRTMSARLT